MMQFLKEFILHPTKIGAAFPSSSHLANKMIQDIDFDTCSCIVEYGPGLGSFTKQILRKKKNDTIYLIIEQNPKFYDKIKKLCKDRQNVIVIRGGAERVDQYLNKYEIKKVDYVVSGLPFTSFPANLTEQILTKTQDVIGECGAFITFQYSKFKLHTFEQYFRVTNSRHEVRNMPPAHVFIMKNK